MLSFLLSLCLQYPQWGCQVEAMKAEYMRRSFVEPVLEAMADAHDIRMDSEASVILILGTIAKESEFGLYTRQIKGPALGICQTEPDTLAWLVDDILERPRYGSLRALWDVYRGSLSPELAVETSWQASIFMCRLRYWVVPAPLPSKHDIEGLADYWNDFYNLNETVGFPHEWIEKYNKFVVGT